MVELTRVESDSSFEDLGSECDEFDDFLQINERPNLMLLSAKENESDFDQIDGVTQGYLQKLSPQFLVGWQLRFVHLDSHTLIYYRLVETQRVMAGVLNFDFYCCYLEGGSEEQHEIEIKVKGLQRSFRFKCENRDSYLQW